MCELQENLTPDIISDKIFSKNYDLQEHIKTDHKPRGWHK